MALVGRRRHVSIELTVDNPTTCLECLPPLTHLLSWEAWRAFTVGDGLPQEPFCRLQDTQGTRGDNGDPPHPAKAAAAMEVGTVDGWMTGVLVERYRMTGSPARMHPTCRPAPPSPSRL